MLPSRYAKGRFGSCRTDPLGQSDWRSGLGEPVDLDRHPYRHRNRTTIFIQRRRELPGSEGADDPGGEERIVRARIDGPNMGWFALFSNRELNQNDLADLIWCNPRLDDLGRDRISTLTLERGANVFFMCKCRDGGQETEADKNRFYVCFHFWVGWFFLVDCLPPGPDKPAAVGA
jgi:hypothetical protein